MNTSPSPHLRVLVASFTWLTFAPVCRDCGCTASPQYQSYDSATGQVALPLCRACYRDRVAQGIST